MYARMVGVLLAAACGTALADGTLVTAARDADRARRWRCSPSGPIPIERATPCALHWAA
jgi:hypothetical protein